MKQKNKFLKIVLSVSLTTSPICPAFAGEIMDSAEKTVRAQQKTADAWAARYVDQDLNAVTRTIVSEVSSKAGADVFQKYAAQREEILQKLKEFNKIDLKTLNITRQQFEQLQRDYESLVRKRFDASWIPSEVAAQQELLGPMMMRIIEDQRQLCLRGRSGRDFNAKIPAEPPPPDYQFDFMVSLGTENAKISYKGYNYEDKNDTRNALRTGSEIALGISGSTLLTGLIFGGVSSSAMAAASVACPVAAVAVVALVAIQHFANLENANRIAGEVAEAELLKFTKMKRDDYIAEKYRESCTTKVQNLEDLYTTIVTIEAGGQQADKLIAKYEAKKPLVDRTRADIEKSQASICRSRLYDAYKETQCEPVKEKEESKVYCQLSADKSLVHAPSANNKPPFCTITLTKDSYAEKRADDVLIESLTQSRIQELAMYDITMNLGVNRQQTLEKMRQVNWEEIDAEQKYAMRKLLDFIRLAEKINSGNLNSANAALGLEVQYTRQFESLRGRLIELSGKAIRIVFQQIPRGNFDAELAVLQKEFKEFLPNGRLVSSVQAMDNSLDNLKRIMAN